MKTAWNCHEDRYIEQWRRPEPDAQHDVYERIIFNNNTNTSQG